MSVQDEEDARIGLLLKNAAAFANSYKSMAPTADATGFRTNELRHRATVSSSSDDRLAESFLINTRLEPDNRESEVSIEGYFGDPGVVMLSMGGAGEDNGLEWVSLPHGVDLPMRLDQSIVNRRSRRVFTGDAMTLDQLATLVRAANGVTARARVELMSGGETEMPLRAIPSGGGLYPLDLYLMPVNVTGLKQAVYKHDPIRDGLARITDESALGPVLESFAVPDEVISVSRSAVILYMVGQPWRSMRKYGNRGLRLVFLEAGAMAEHINLATVALGFGSVDCAAVYDRLANEALDLDGLYRTVIHTVVVGYPG